MHPVYESMPPGDRVWRGGVNKLLPNQIAHRGTWSAIPDRPGRHSDLGQLHAIDVMPSANGTSTVTVLNPLDPATVDDIGRGDEYGAAWLARPGGRRIVPARGMRP